MPDAACAVAIAVGNHFGRLVWKAGAFDSKPAQLRLGELKGACSAVACHLAFRERHPYGGLGQSALRSIPWNPVGMRNSGHIECQRRDDGQDLHGLEIVVIGRFDQSKLWLVCVRSDRWNIKATVGMEQEAASALNTEDIAWAQLWSLTKVNVCPAGNAGKSDAVWCPRAISSVLGWDCGSPQPSATGIIKANKRQASCGAAPTEEKHEVMACRLEAGHL